MKENQLNVSIGGTQYPVRVLYKDVESFFINFNKILIKNNDKSNLKIPNTFFFNTLWKCLESSGYLFWKKPFRSKRQMINSLLYDEITQVTMFVSKHILKFEEDTTDPDIKKKQTQTEK